MAINKKYLVRYRNQATEEFKKVESKISLLEYIGRTSVGIPQKDIEYIEELILNDIEKDLNKY